MLGTIVGFLLPIAHKDDQYAQYHRMAARMYDALAYNHEAMPLGATRSRCWAPAGSSATAPLWASAAVFQRMLHGTFARLCRDRLALDCRCPQYELRSLEIMVERMPPAQGRRHALEQVYTWQVLRLPSCRK